MGANKNEETSQKQNKNVSEKNENDWLKEKDLLDNLGKIAYTLDKTYLSTLSTDYSVLCFNDRYNKENVICYENNIRALRIERWVFDKDEKPGECFKNVLSLFADGDHTIALVVKRTEIASEMYFVIKNEGEARNEDSASNLSLLEDSIKGNFPGTYTRQLNVTETKKALDFSDKKSISIMTNIPSEFSEDYITQGLDKLLNGIVPMSSEDEYTVVFLAESLSQSAVREILSGYEDIATAIYPFLQYQFQIGESKVDTKGEMRSSSTTKSISESVFKTHSVNIGINGGFSKNNSVSDSHSRSVDKREFSKMVLGKGGQVAGSIIGGLIGGPLGAKLGSKIGRKAGETAGSLAPTNTKTHTETHGSGANIGASAGYGYSWGTSKTVSNGTTDTEGTSSSISIGETKNTSYNYKSYLVSNMLEKLEKTMQRIDISQSTGLWKYSVYVIANNSKTSKNVASYLRAVTQGNDSYIEPAFVQEWSYEDSNMTTPFNEIMDYIQNFTHPVFAGLEIESDNNDSEKNERIMFVTPTSYVATNELGYIISFPRKSIQGLPVLEGVQFGREPHSLLPIESEIELGCGYHMFDKVESQRIKLSEQELTKHTFITGSTGSGKSNTIYTLLSALSKEKVKFLVVEPAKGEYKKVIGRYMGAITYGTNPNLTDSELLRINPFKFPKSIHILEHLDRLIEIFNVCWPMYAAMPAILKDAVERAYTVSGWDLTTSVNRYDDRLFPTFSDVLTQIKTVLKESDYSDNNKGDYTGALVTRIKSLTNGINGLIFSSDDLSDEELFDNNAIIDLSRVGSTETKAMIMGIVILKLHEHRMDSSSEPNSKLKHITVLEEAHNLLKRTSTEQVSEGANLLGKSVEMLANSIAEMRTYGEGFVIADQSPGLLDLSVIRNTNTKIIMRLPNISDRELVGKAAGLSDDQINEINRLENGVAAVIQSEWLEPVLCKVDKYDPTSSRSSDYAPKKKHKNEMSNIGIKESLLESIMNELCRANERVDIQEIREKIIRSNLMTMVKCDFLDYIYNSQERDVKKLGKLAYNLLEAEKAIEKSRKYADINKWLNSVIDYLDPSVKGYSNRQIDLLLALILNEKALRDSDYENIFCRFTEIYRKNGGVI